MSRKLIGEAVSHRLHRTEAAIDAAMYETARLAALLPRARSRAGLAAVTGQAAFNGSAAALGALTQARAHLVQTHTTLSVLARRLGLAAVAAGPLDKPDDRPPIGGNILPLRASNPAPIINKTLPRATRTC